MNTDTPTTPLTAAELDEIERRTRAPGGLVHGYEIRRLVAMARRGMRLEAPLYRLRRLAKRGDVGWTDEYLIEVVDAALTPTTTEATDDQ